MHSYYYAFDACKGVTQPKHELLYRMVTGDRNAPRFPQLAVRWLTPPTEIAALVAEASTSRFTAELFHFGTTPRKLSAELRQLAPGDYRASLWAGDADVPLVNTAVRIERGRPTTVPITLPARKLCVLRLEPAP
jgi:hypothetical protein